MFRNSRDKIRVVILGGYKPKKRNCEIKDGKVIIFPAEKNGGEAITATYDNSCLIPYETGPPLIRSLRHYLLWKQGTSRCISLANNETTAPNCTKEEVRTFAKATVLSRAGNPKEESKTLIYIFLGALIILGIFNLLVSSGTIRLG